MSCFFVNLPVVKNPFFLSNRHQYQNGNVLPSLCSPYVEIISVTISLKSGKSWAVQTEETEPANNQFPVGRLSKIHQGKYLTNPVYLTHMMWKLQKWSITRENNIAALVCKSVFQLPRVLSSKRCLGSCASRGSTGQTHPKVAAKKHFLFFLHQNVSPGRRPSWFKTWGGNVHFFHQDAQGESVIHKQKN